MVYAMPYSYLQKVRSVPGVVAAISWNWFGGAIDPTKGVEFPNFAVDPEGFGEVYADWGLDPKVFDEFAKYRNAALVGSATMEKHGWKVGDEISLQSTVFPVPPLSFRIVGVTPSNGGSPMYFQREYLAQALAAVGVQFDQTGMIWSRIDDPERVGSVMSEIDAMFKNSEAVTTTETEKSFIGNFFSGFKQLILVIEIVAGLVALCIVFIAANTASMSVRERVGEIAILKAIGFRKQVIFGTLLAEAGLLSTIAGVIGVLISLGITLVLKRIASTGGPAMGPLTSFVIGSAIIVEGLFLGFLVGIVAGWIPALGASRRSVAQTLREVF
jgi:putative ABC transport system permease protein